MVRLSCSAIIALQAAAALAQSSVSVECPIVPTIYITTQATSTITNGGCTISSSLATPSLPSRSSLSSSLRSASDVSSVSSIQQSTRSALSATPTTSPVPKPVSSSVSSSVSKIQSSVTSTLETMSSAVGRSSSSNVASSHSSSVASSTSSPCTATTSTHAGKPTSNKIPTITHKETQPPFPFPPIALPPWLTEHPWDFPRPTKLPIWKHWEKRSASPFSGQSLSTFAPPFSGQSLSTVAPVTCNAGTVATRTVTVITGTVITTTTAAATCTGTSICAAAPSGSPNVCRPAPNCNNPPPRYILTDPDLNGFTAAGYFDCGENACFCFPDYEGKGYCGTAPIPTVANASRVYCTSNADCVDPGSLCLIGEASPAGLQYWCNTVTPCEKPFNSTPTISARRRKREEGRFMFEV